MAQAVAKFPPRSVDDHSFGIPDFEPLLNSYQAAQLLDISSQDPTEVGSTWRDSRLLCRKMWRFRASDLNAWLDRQERAS
jgi:hypothetical protein